MTLVLASVASADEAQLALVAGAGLIDLKDPGTGALGALPASVIRAALERVAGRRTVSATAGDLPMAPRTIARAVERVAALGVDLVKVGLFPGGDVAGCLRALETIAARGARIVAVLFADLAPDFELVERARDHGLAGVMLDTSDKPRGSLREHVSDARLAEFVGRARRAGLLTGLAGSLRATDVPALLACGPDYLGFRGALCRDGRAAELDLERTRAICIAVHSAAIAATATAGAQRAAPSRSSGVPSISVAKST